MPSKGTTARAFDLDDTLWDACKAKSAKTGIDVTSVVRDALMAWAGMYDNGHGITSAHRYECADHAAIRAYVNDMVNTYPSKEATTAGLGLLDGDIVDCRCSEI